MPGMQLKQLSSRTLWEGLALLLLCLVLFFWQLDGYSLFNITEAKQAEIARQFWVRNDWITPIYNREGVYYDKPVLLHWLMAIGYVLFGLNEWAVRLPSAVAATGLVFGTWRFVGHFANRQVAFLTATMLVANPLSFGLARLGQHDMLLVCFMTLGLYCWYWAYCTGRASGYLAFFGLLGLAVMAKGPLAIALCGLIIGGFLTAVGRWQEQFVTIPWAWGIFLFSAIALPWYILVIALNGWEFMYEAFVHNNVSRFLSPNLNQAGPWWYYLPVTLIGFFPWLLLLPAAWARTFERQWLRLDFWKSKPPHQQLGLFMALWFLVVLLFMSLAATKLPWYTYPGFPALAYLCAQAWSQQVGRPGRWLKLSFGLIAGGYAVLAIALALVPRFITDAAIVRSIQASQILWLWVPAYGIAAVAMLISAARQQALWGWIVGLIVFSWTAVTAVNPLLMTLDHTVLDGRLIPIAERLHQETCDTCEEDIVVAFGVTDPSLNFYSCLSDIPRLEEASEVEALLRQPQRVLLVTDEAVLQQKGLTLSGYEPALAIDEFKLFIISPDSSGHSRREEPSAAASPTAPTGSATEG